MLALLVLLLLVAAVCGRLGVWQLERAYERSNLAKVHASVELEGYVPPPLGEVLSAQAPFPGNLVGKSVTVTGEFEPGSELLVAGRSVGERPVFLVLSALRVTDDGTGGKSWADLSGPPVLPVVRGWIPAAAMGPDNTLYPDSAKRIALPTGPVQIEGWLQASEANGTLTLPAGQSDSISSASLANQWGGPIYGGYLVVKHTDPATDSALGALVRPQIEHGADVNTQSLFYALQWWVFGIFAVALWVRLVADEAARGPKAKAVNPFDKVDAAP